MKPNRLPKILFNYLLKGNVEWVKTVFALTNCEDVFASLCT